MNEVANPIINRFLARLEKLDAGGRARLKRGAGQAIAEARETTGLFYSLLPAGVNEFQESAYFLIATLYPMTDAGGNDDFGATLRRAVNDKNRKGIDRRMQILLEADAAQLAFRLRQAVQFLRSQRVHVNWHQLLADVLLWTHPDRPVQRRWARSYYAESLNLTKE